MPENALVQKFYDCCDDVLVPGAEIDLAKKLQHFHDVVDVQHISEFIENATIERS